MAWAARSSGIIAGPVARGARFGRAFVRLRYQPCRGRYANRRHHCHMGQITKDDANLPIAPAALPAVCSRQICLRRSSLAEAPYIRANRPSDARMPEARLFGAKREKFFARPHGLWRFRLPRHRGAPQFQKKLLESRLLRLLPRHKHCDRCYPCKQRRSARLATNRRSDTRENSQNACGLSRRDGKETLAFPRNGHATISSGGNGRSVSMGARITNHSCFCSAVPVWQLPRIRRSIPL